MPHHFEYTEMDFKSGLWSVGDWLIPNEGAAEMTDCYPQLGGGLRAWAKMNTFSRNGISASEFPVAIFARGGVSKRSGSGSGTDFYLMTGNHSTDQNKLYRWDNSENPEPSTWTLLKTFVAGNTNSPGEVIFNLFDSDTQPVAVYMTMAYSGSSDQGLWRIAYSNGAMTQLTTHTGPRAFVIHQDRLLYGTVEANATRIRYSNAHSETFDAANFFDLLPDQALADNAWARSYVGELFVGKQGTPLILLQGDINEPVARIMSDTHFSAETQEVTELPEGIVYCAYNDGYYVTRSGIDVTPLNAKIATGNIAAAAAVRGDHTVTVGNPKWASPFFVTPSGHIWDYRTQAWFRSSEFGPGMTRPICKHMAYDRHVDEGRVYMTTDKEDFEILYFEPNESKMERRRSYSYKTPPIRTKTGRLNVIREVQLPMKVFANGASCQVSCGGVTRSISGINAGQQTIRFPFDAVGEYLDVRVVPDSGSASVEAPSLETVRIGHLDGHHIPADTVV